MKAARFVGTLIATMIFGANAWAGTGDTSVANLNVSGNVPTVFSVTARGLPGDLDLAPGAVVVDRLLGILHFKFNENAASITIKSSTANGVPRSAAGVDYPFDAGGPFKVGIMGSTTCTSLTAAFAAGVTLAAAGADYASAAAKDLTASTPDSGIEEDCQVVANWKGTTAALPLAGTYSMTITVTMVAL